MRREQLRRAGPRESASACVIGTPSTVVPLVGLGSAAHFSKSIVPGNGVSRTNCAKVRSACSASATVASNVLAVVARQAEDERPEHVDAVAAERAQPRDQRVAGQVEALVDVLQSRGGHRFDADQRAADVRARASRPGTPDPRPLPW